MDTVKDSMHGNYFASTKKSHYSVLFLLPLLLVYEAGLFRGVLGENINGADAIVRLFFYVLYGFLGVTAVKVLVAVVISGLVVYLLYSLVTRKIQVRFLYLFGMIAESAVLAFLVGIIIHIGINRDFPRFFSMQPNPGVVAQLAISGIEDGWAKIVASIGAGIFEELVFRVVLIRILYAFWKSGHYRTFGTDRNALLQSVGMSSAIFTLMHLGSVGSVFGLISIFFGSVIFSAMYLYRGYGIAAGTHIGYDIYLMFGILA